MRAGTFRLRTIGAAVGLVLCGLWAARALAFLPPRYGGAVVVPLMDKPLTLRPAAARRQSELVLVSLLYDTLYRIEGGVAHPHLVEGAPRLSEAGRRVELRIRSGVRLHDGSELRASDVCAALKASRLGPHGYVLEPVSRCVALDGTRFVLSLTRADSGLSMRLSAPSTAIGVARGTRMVGSGPYRLARQEATRWQLVVHSGHFAGRSYLDRIELRHFGRTQVEAANFQVGKAQLSFHGTALFGAKPRFRADRIRSRAASTVFVALGARASELANEPTMGQLSRALNRARIARLAGGAPALAADRCVSPELAEGFPKTVLWRALGAVFAPMARVVRPALSAGRPARVLMVDKTQVDDDAIAGQVVADLDRVGLPLRIESVSAEIFERRRASGDYELALLRHSPQLPVGAFAVAGVLALGGETTLARACSAARCPPARVRRALRKIRLLPLIHVVRRLHFDARLSGLAFDACARLRLRDLHWRRADRKRGQP